MNVAEGLETEICSVRKAERRCEMFADCHRKEVSCRSEGVMPCKEVRMKKVVGRMNTCFFRLKCSSVYAVRKLSECCCLYTARSVWSVACFFTS